MVQNKSLVFAKVPERTPVPGEHLKIEDRGFDLDQQAPKDGLAVQTLYVSFDPYLRGRMREQHVKSYLPAFPLGEPIISFSVFKVLKSNNSNWSEGEYGTGVLPVAEYNAIDGESVNSPPGIFAINKITRTDGIDLSYYIGAMGMPGLTAYTSFYDIGQPKKGETIYISAASGAVGQLVGSLALHEGLRVIGSVGSDEKLSFIQELGFEGWNYKKEKPSDALKRLAPDGIEIYYDNVGGEQFEAALDSIKNFGRIVACGQVSQYNLPAGEKYGIKNTELFFGKQLSMRGFLVAQYEPKWYDELKEKVGDWIAEGEIKPRQTFTEGMDNAAQGFVDMLNGKNLGKATLVVSKP
jgi:NADPH-dependent curcumin reductase CurA